MKKKLRMKETKYNIWTFPGGLKGPDGSPLRPRYTHSALYLNGFLIDGSGVSDSVDLCSSLDVNVEHQVALFRLHSLRRSLIHSHSMPCQSICLLQLSIQQVDGWEMEQIVEKITHKSLETKIDLNTTLEFHINTLKSSITFGKLLWTPIQSLLKQISRSLQLLASISIDELGEVCVPDVIHIWPPEERNATLICLKYTRDLWAGDVSKTSHNDN